MSTQPFGRDALRHKLIGSVNSSMVVLVERWVPEDDEIVLEFLRMCYVKFMIEEGHFIPTTFKIIRTELTYPNSRSQQNARKPDRSLTVEVKEETSFGLTSEEVGDNPGVTWAKLEQVMAGERFGDVNDATLMLQLFAEGVRRSLRRRVLDHRAALLEVFEYKMGRTELDDKVWLVLLALREMVDKMIDEENKAIDLIWDARGGSSIR